MELMGNQGTRQREKVLKDLNPRKWSYGVWEKLAMGTFPRTAATILSCTGSEKPEDPATPRPPRAPRGPSPVLCVQGTVTKSQSNAPCNGSAFS